MAELIDIFSLWTTANRLTYRVYAAMIEESLAIKQEPDTTPNHTKRMQLANKVLSKPLQIDQQVMATSYARALQEPGLLEEGDASTDEEVRTAVAAIINDVANSG